MKINPGQIILFPDKDIGFIVSTNEVSSKISWVHYRSMEKVVHFTDVFEDPFRYDASLYTDIFC